MILLQSVKKYLTVKADTVWQENKTRKKEREGYFLLGRN